jgi:hypothetical protein
MKRNSGNKSMKNQEEVIVNCLKTQNEDIHNFDSSPNIIEVTTSKRM